MQKDTFLGENHTFPSIKAKPPPVPPRGRGRKWSVKREAMPSGWLLSPPRGSWRGLGLNNRKRMIFAKKCIFLHFLAFFYC